MSRAARFLPIVITVALAVGACGGTGSGDAEEAPAPSPSVTAEPAPEALSEFSCTAAEDGTWTAAGTITNDAEDEVASFTVDVYVGPADGQERPVQRTRVENVQAGESTPLQMAGVPAQGDPATCHVRVLRDVTG